MANGYGMLMCVVQEPDNVPFLQESLERHFWHQHMSMDTLVGRGLGVLRGEPAVGVQGRVGGVGRSRLRRLLHQPGSAPSGSRPPDRLGEVAPVRRRTCTTHVAIALAAIWPLNFWRIDPMGPADYEWFENHYPGWTARYGGLWDAYRAMSDPSSGRILMQELPALPPFCQVCHVPCVMPRIDAPETLDLDLRGQALRGSAARDASGSSSSTRRSTPAALAGGSASTGWTSPTSSWPSATSGRTGRP